MSGIATIHRTTITGEELAPLIMKLEQAAEGEDRDRVVVALLAMSLVVVYPEITPEQLQKAVGDLSGYLCMLIDPTEGAGMLAN